VVLVGIRPMIGPLHNLHAHNHRGMLVVRLPHHFMECIKASNNLGKASVGKLIQRVMLLSKGSVVLLVVDLQ
jgi:hypothetical protein